MTDAKVKDAAMDVAHAEDMEVDDSFGMFTSEDFGGTLDEMAAMRYEDFADIMLRIPFLDGDSAERCLVMLKAQLDGLLDGKYFRNEFNGLVYKELQSMGADDRTAAEFNDWYHEKFPLSYASTESIFATYPTASDFMWANRVDYSLEVKIAIRHVYAKHGKGPWFAGDGCFETVELEPVEAGLDGLDDDALDRLTQERKRRMDGESMDGGGGAI